MSNDKQSSIDYLIKQKAKYGMIINDDLRIAKAMHKEEMINFHVEVMKIGLIKEGERIWTDAYLPKIKEIATEYYNETFGGNNENL